MTNTRKPKRRWMPIAASMALLAAAAMFFFSQSTTPDPKQLFAENYKPETTILNNIIDRMESSGLADEKTTADDSLLTALKHYENYEYAKARTNLSKYMETYPEDQTARFYMGLTQLQMENYATSIDYLLPLVTEEGFANQDAAQWYLAMACTQLDGVDGMALAKKHFTRLANNDKSVYQGNAKAYMQALGL